MTKRKSISKSIRFEVFKRDRFTCVYCGATAPDVTLTIDHVHPVAKGGDNDILNLVTCCWECNAGKSDRTLSDDTVVAKQRAQLEQLQERREQIEMMMEWQRGLIDTQTHAVDQVCKLYSECVPGWSLNESGRTQIKAALASTSLERVLQLLREIATKHLRTERGKVTEESARRVCTVFLGAIKYDKFKQSDPVGSELRYIRGILRNRLRYCNEATAMDLLREAHRAGSSVAELKDMACTVRNWTEWCQRMNALIEGGGNQ